MNIWRKKRDMFRHDGSPEDLADINEQELAKDTPRGEHIGGRRESDGIPKTSDRSDISDGSNKNTDIAAIYDSPIVRADEKRDISKPYTAKKKSEHKGNDDEDIVKEFVSFDDGEDEEEGRRDASAAFFKTVIILSMLVSLLIFAFVMLGAYSDGEEPIPELPEDTQTDSEQVIREGDRVIYIRELDEDSGIMTTSEIYEKNNASVVTVIASIGNTRSVGTGFVLSSDGYVATASHTLDGAESISVLLCDGRRVDANIVGKDEFSDLALLRIYTDGLIGVELGDSDKLLVGERIVAIGTPYSEEFSGSAFSGSISNCNRVVSVYDDKTGKLEKKMTFVQLSATLGKGCSGCPVFDEYGKVIGVLSARLGDGTNGVCFAIPINGAAEILNKLKSGESVENSQNAVATPAPRLGVLGVTVNENGVRGVKISSFTDDTCDAASKLKAGDVIVSVASHEVFSYSDVSDAISKYLVGDHIEVTVWRSGQRLTFIVELID